MSNLRFFTSRGTYGEWLIHLREIVDREPRLVPGAPEQLVYQTRQQQAAAIKVLRRDGWKWLRERRSK